LDPDYEPQPILPPTNADGAPSFALEPGEQLVVVRGEIADDVTYAELEASPQVAAVWTDAEVQAFPVAEPEAGEDLLALASAAVPCPCTQNGCDCNAGPGGNHGTDVDMATYLGAPTVWAAGVKGNGIVVGVVDTGVRSGSFPGKVIGGWSPPGGSPPGDNGAHYHGSMCTNAVLAVAPDAKIYDIGLLKSTGPISGLLSNAIAGYNWALTQYATDGTPQILTNSWGMYQKAWAPDYATDANHPFTRKVVEVINQGILVTFAAGNCGEVCPSGQCGADNGPGKSIWGANSHPLVMTVGAANIDEQWIGYTSQGPGALAPDKPNFCAPSHFRGFTANDNGTSAACPVAAGVVALLRAADPSLRQARAKLALQDTAKDLCVPGWDANSGYGMISALRAYKAVVAQQPCCPRCGVQWRGQIPAKATQRWFTFRWPAILHVSWSVMPTSPRNGGPQLSWDVDIERADGDYVTYWITVQNLTDQAVDFEGRYCILGRQA
jgi:subtilisin family serine protease